MSKDQRRLYNLIQIQIQTQIQTQTQSIGMGSDQSHPNLEQKYTFFQAYDDSNFGACQIYRNNQLHNQYALCIRRYLQQQKLPFIQQRLEQFRRKNLDWGMSPFLRIIDWEIQRDGFFKQALAHSCMIPQIKIFIEFLRHNLRQFIQWRKSLQRPLSYDQIILALNQAVSAFQKTKNNLIIGVSLNLQHISITTQGQIKFNPLSSKLPQHLAELSSSRLNPEIHESRPFKSWAVDMRTANQDFGKDIPLEQSQFLGQLKKFMNQLVWDSGNHLLHARNPEKQIKRLLVEIRRTGSLKAVKKIIGQSSLKSFLVKFDKLKHEESEARFQKLASELSEKSQQTDYSTRKSISHLIKNKQTFLAGQNMVFH